MSLRPFLLLTFVIGSSIAEDCWWSGCQPHTWAQRGCYPEDKYYQTDSRPCDGGDMYRCCPKSGSGSGGNGGNGDSNNEIDDNFGIESGICSYYGAEGEIPPGHPTASGEGFDRFAMKAAHKTLPFGTKIRVKNLNNKKTVEVTINDRGPFTPGRIVDLTYGAFGKVENHDKGLFKCSYAIL